VARDFDGSTDRIDYANVYAPGSGAITFAGWVFPDVVNVDQRLVAIHDSGDTDVELAASIDPFTEDGGLAYLLDWTTGLSFRERYGTGDLATGSWQHFIVQSTDGSGTNAECWVDGAIPGSTSTGDGSGSAESTAGTWSLGGAVHADTENLNGRLAEVAVWDRILTADERNALAKGHSPLFFRNGLRFYAPLIRDERAIIPGDGGTLDGTAVIEHPRIIMPS
jgi:hypothetical protein